jgi:hypothetical protein
MPTEWHYTSPVDFLDHWQSLLAGLIALVAAIVAVVVTIWIERGKAREEVYAVRSSLAVELRVMLARTYGAHTLFRDLAQQKGPITARQVESFAHLPDPVVYRATCIAQRLTKLASLVTARCKS